MHLKLRVSKVYEKHAEDLEAEYEKIKAGSYNHVDLLTIIDKILEDYKDDIQDLWEKYPEMNHMGFKFELGDVFLGKDFHSVMKEAEQLYKGKEFEPLLDYMKNRHVPVLWV